MRSSTALLKSLLVESSQFVPAHKSASNMDLEIVEQFLLTARKLFVLTGAGVSTESGIKDYRSEGVGLYSISTARPTNYSDFLKSASVRQRYWARNTTAWPFFSSLKPNISHQALATLEHKGRLHWLVTQNVDNLHHMAGSRRLTELHGNVFSVICLQCRWMISREEMQSKILSENDGWAAQPRGFAPDADVVVSESEVKRFHTPHCDRCGGVMKPDVVFFGDTVPKRRVEFVNERLRESDACMVVGSSVETYSCLRHVRQCRDLGIPLLIVNIGPTRADAMADPRVHCRAGELFEKLFERNNL